MAHFQKFESLIPNGISSQYIENIDLKTDQTTDHHSTESKMEWEFVSHKGTWARGEVLVPITTP